MTATASQIRYIQSLASRISPSYAGQYGWATPAGRILGRSASHIQRKGLTSAEASRVIDIMRAG
jgi:hypothetical protein